MRRPSLATEPTYPMAHVKRRTLNIGTRASTLRAGAPCQEHGGASDHSMLLLCRQFARSPIDAWGCSLHPSCCPLPRPSAHPVRTAADSDKGAPPEARRGHPSLGGRRVQARGQHGTNAPRPLEPEQMEPPRQCSKRSISRAVAAPSSASVRKESKSVFVRAASKASLFDERREEPALSSLVSSVLSSCSRWR